MLQSELHSSSILEAKLSPSNQPLFKVVHEENGLAQLQIRITDGTQHWSGHIVADDIQASNDEMRTQKFALTRTALKAPTNELALHCDLQPSSNSLKILVKRVSKIQTFRNKFRLCSSHERATKSPFFGSCRPPTCS